MKTFLKLFSSAYWAFTLCGKNEVEPNRKTYPQTTAIFPLVGMVMGAILSFFHKIMSYLVPEDILDFLVIILLATFTRGQHLIGLATLIGSFLKAESGKEKYLKANQGFLLIFCQLVKSYSLVQVPPIMKPASIFLMPIASGWAMVQLCWLENLYLKAQGNQANLIHLVTWKEFTVATCITLAIFAPFLKLKGLGIVIIIILFSLFFLKTFHNQIRIFDRNALGAFNELSQPVFLISIRFLYGDY